MRHLVLRQIKSIDQYIRRIMDDMETIVTPLIQVCRLTLVKLSRGESADTAQREYERAARPAGEMHKCTRPESL
jgi:hypothetical protein